MHKLRCFIVQGAPANIQAHSETRGYGFGKAIFIRPELWMTFEEASEGTRVSLASRAPPVVRAAFHSESDIRFVGFVNPRFIR